MMDYLLYWCSQHLFISILALWCSAGIVLALFMECIGHDATQRRRIRKEIKQLTHRRPVNR